MSSRALRRLEENDLEKTLAKLAPSTQKRESSTKPSAAKPPKQVNLFALMGQDEDEDSENSENSDSENKSASASSEDKPVQKPVQVLTKSQRKKNKKNKKSKQKPKVAPEMSEAEDGNKESDEELDRMILQFQKKDLEQRRSAEPGLAVSDESDYDTAFEDEEVSNLKGPVDLKTDPGFTSFTSFSEITHVFGDIDMKNLNPDNEYKLLFGDLSPESLADVDSMTSTHVSPQVMKQIEKLKHMVRNWGGRDYKTVPNGSTTRRLAFTKIREDWVPTPRGEFTITQLSQSEVVEWQSWLRSQDWIDEVKKTVHKWKNAGINFYKFEPSNAETNRKAMTEFYMSVVLHPDHEALIHLISSKFPYHVPALLQVALILVRQGDKANSNGLVERALFVFDRALRSHISFNGLSCQLPYIYFFNRQFYFAIFRYVQILSQRGVVSTASEWCKVLWSLSPLEDPLGCRYFIDHYLLLNKEYSYMANLASSPLVTTYTQWYTLGLSLGFVLSFLKLDMVEKAKAELRKAFACHTAALATIFKDVALGDANLLEGLDSIEGSPETELETKAYLIRMKAIWGGVEIRFLHEELVNILTEYKAGNKQLKTTTSVEAQNELFLGGIPINLLRFAVLSQESPLMACIPQEIWSERDVYEFDVLPPLPHDRDSENLVETVKTFVSESDLSMSQMEIMQDENILNQIRQLSLEQFLQDNPNADLGD
ncbi:LAQU0S10e02168g1_1 [Lachancea quebecensis]|uniref:LAQU0S10e02168g1_1 n=1 Tax=Lachancea quebecensis TaxID=1654605 RepID=A0A0P1L0Q2_9SACH|nr:LAQU0S10e02168g1_1 [Lachancea quebecensis]